MAIEADPLIGTRLQNRYLIESVIGQGGMGIVYKAKHEQIDRPVAIKMLHAHMVSDADAMKRFHREAKAVSRVRHPHSITLYDFGVSQNGQPFIVMDYVEGTNLKRVLKQEGHLALTRVEHIFEQVVDALDCAHCQGVIHRDLKPENIMLTESAGDPDFVQVVDFGISKVKATDEHKTSEYNITRIGDVCGSPPYMSPEQCLGSNTIDFRSDIYALAVVLFEAVTGRLPFKAKSAIEMIDCHLYAPPTPLKAANPELALYDELNGMLMKALQKEPEKRQQTMKDFGRELSQALKRDAVNVHAARARLAAAEQVNGPGLLDTGDYAGNAVDTGDGARLACGSSSGAAGNQPVIGFWQKILSFITGHMESQAQPAQLHLDNCPYCACPLKHNVRFCLDCGRNLPSAQDLTKLRLAQGVYTLPKSRRKGDAAPDFSTRAKMATSKPEHRLGMIRLTIMAILLSLLLWCLSYILQCSKPAQNRQSEHFHKNYVKFKRHYR